MQGAQGKGSEGKGLAPWENLTPRRWGQVGWLTEVT